MAPYLTFLANEVILAMESPYTCQKIEAHSANCNDGVGAAFQRCISSSFALQ
ncbi:MAG: hypothetical protein K8F27_02375 [Sulfuricellaceae bacterium]|jgi:hypothetical protein|nr:hypothetical protein [Sulfuricellaceae bacterium]